MLAMCRCLLRLDFRVCSYDLVLLAGYACMPKMRFCCVLGCWCRCLLVYGLFTWFDLAFWLCLYAKKMVSWCVPGWWCQTLLRLWFTVCSHGLLLLVGYASTRKKWFLAVFWIASFRLSPANVHLPPLCVLQKYTQRTTYLNWA